MITKIDAFLFINDLIFSQYITPSLREITHEKNRHHPTLGIPGIL